MKYMKLALFALLIPSAALSMERAKNVLKKTAAAGTILSLGYLGYQAAQAYGFENLNNDILTGWQASKNWLHGKVYGSYEQEKARLTAEIAALRATISESNGIAENQAKHHNAQLKQQLATIEVLQKNLADLRVQNEKLERALVQKQATPAMSALPIEIVAPKEELKMLPIVEESKEKADLSVRSTISSDNRPLNQYEEYRKALRGDIVNMATIFASAKKAFDAIDSIMAGNKIFDVEVKPKTVAAEYLLGEFIEEVTQKDLNFENDATIQKARKLLADCQIKYDFILSKLNDLNIEFEKRIRNQYYAGAYRNISSDLRLKGFNSFVDSFSSRKDQCRTHENYIK